MRIGELKEQIEEFKNVAELAEERASLNESSLKMKTEVLNEMFEIVRLFKDKY